MDSYNRIVLNYGLYAFPRVRIPLMMIYGVACLSYR